MNIPTLCPACLAELPDDYPYDHVAIDLALTSRPRLYRAMTRGEQAELIRIALRRGFTANRLARHLGRNLADLTALLPARQASAERQRFEDQVRDLWAKGQPDAVIGVHTGHDASWVARTRNRLGLAANYGTRGRGRTAVAA